MSLKVSRCLPALALLLSAQLPLKAQQSMCAPVSNNPLVMENLCNDAPRAQAVPAIQKTEVSQSTQNLLTLTAADINSMRLTEPPMILMGDVLVFEANREDFILEIFLSNGKEIVSQPQRPGDTQGVSVGWKKGRAKLDYPESVNQHIIGMKITALHQSSTPLLLRGVKIDRKGRYILELEKSNPRPQKQFEAPMSYPPDPHVMTASVTMPSLLGREPQTGFIASHIPAFAMAPMMFQASGADGNHYKYTGKEFDAETGLYYYGARYYSPGLGRFTSADPTVLSRQRMFDPQQWNMYSYARNNPLKYTDPDGKELQLATGMSKDDTQRVTKALVEVYRKPGGASRIENLAKSDMKFVVGTGDLKGEGYGLTKATGKFDANHKVDRSSTTVTVTLDFAQSDKDKADHDLGLRKDAPPADDQVTGHEMVHADIFNSNPDGQIGKSPAQKEADAAPGTADLNADKKGDKKAAEKRVTEILKPDKKKPEN
jgi:RHS repeat-associated protein